MIHKRCWVFFYQNSFIDQHIDQIVPVLERNTLNQPLAVVNVKQM